MPHALIIDENIAISRAIQHYLATLGFDSFDHTWTELQALAAARAHRPDIIVIGDDIETGCVMRAAQMINSDGTIPVLMVSGDPARASQRLARASSYDGPFRINQLEEAVALAMQQRVRLH
jgi:DNA-binding response OmpR family regulator